MFFVTFHYKNPIWFRELNQSSEYFFLNRSSILISTIFFLFFIYFCNIWFVNSLLISQSTYFTYFLTNSRQDDQLRKRCALKIFSPSFYFQCWRDCVHSFNRHVMNTHSFLRHYSRYSNIAMKQIMTTLL